MNDFIADAEDLSSSEGVSSGSIMRASDAISAAPRPEAAAPMPEEAPIEPMLDDEPLNGGDTGATPSDAGPTPIDVGAPAGAPTTSASRTYSRLPRNNPNRRAVVKTDSLQSLGHYILLSEMMI